MEKLRQDPVKIDATGVPEGAGKGKGKGRGEEEQKTMGKFDPRQIAKKRRDDGEEGGEGRGYKSRWRMMSLPKIRSNVRAFAKHNGE